MGKCATIVIEDCFTRYPGKLGAIREKRNSAIL
jgi:hypothetical protein